MDLYSVPINIGSFHASFPSSCWMMIASTKRWIRRNRVNFAVGASVLGAGYVASQYILSKISETRQRMSDDRIAKENLRRRFQQNQEDCTITVLALLPTATENILAALPVEQITEDLQQKKAERLGRGTIPRDGVLSEVLSGPSSVADEDGKSQASLNSGSYVHASQTVNSNKENGGNVTPKQSKSRAQLWNELKISSITRTFTLLYTLSLLTILTRIQLNLLGRQSYLSSVVSMASHPPHDLTIRLENRDDDNTEPSYDSDFQTNRKFLTFSWWLLHRGWKDLMQNVEKAVKDVFAALSPREDVSLGTLSGAILDVRKKVEGASLKERRNRRWLPYLLPPNDQEDLVLRESGMLTPLDTPGSSDNPSPPESSEHCMTTQSGPLRRLLDETSDLIESPTFSQILTLLLDATFSHLTDQKLRSEAYKLPDVSDHFPSDTQAMLDSDPTQAHVKLATILAVVTRQAHAIGNGLPNEYVQAMDSVNELEAFAAVIYSSHFEFAVPNDQSLKHSGQSPTTETNGSQKSMQKTQTAKAEQSGVLDPTTTMFEHAWGEVVSKEIAAARD